MVHFERIEQLKEAINGSEGWTLRRELSGLARSYRLFLANDRELHAYLKEQSEAPKVLELWDVRNRDGFERFLDENTRRVWRKHLPAENELRVEHDRRVADIFALSPLPQFVQRLRNYTLHTRLPVARGKLSMTHGGQFDSRVVLVRDELIRWNGWSEQARRYLTAAPADIALLDVIDDYTERVVHFNDWFGRAFVGSHLRAFDELERLEQELAAAYREVTPT